MSQIRSMIYSAVSVMLMASGCGEDDRVEQFLSDTAPLELREPGQLREAARYSDPSILVVAATAPAELTLSMFRDDEDQPDCPRLIDASDREAGVVEWRIEGCGWSKGSIVARGDTNATTIEYRGFRQSSVSSQCAGEETAMAASGVVTVPYPIFPWNYADFDDLPPEPADQGKGHYDIHVMFEQYGLDYDDCQATRTLVAYDATIERRLERTDTSSYDWNDTWDMQGRAAVRQETRPGPEEPWQPVLLAPAAWRLSADDYGIIRDGDACEGDFVTGTLRLESRGDVAVLHPDATTSCFDGSEDGAAQYAACTLWSLNGEEQHEEMCGFVWLMDGVGCSAGPDTPPPLAAIAIVLAGLLWQRRRRLGRAA